MSEPGLYIPEVRISESKFADLVGCVDLTEEERECLRWSVGLPHNENIVAGVVCRERRITEAWRKIRKVHPSIVKPDPCVA